MWKIQNFPATQMLREINFSYVEVQKNAFMTHIEALNFDFVKFKPGKIAKNSAKPKLRDAKFSK